MYVFTVALRHLRSRSITWVASALTGAVVVLYLLIISVMEGQTHHWMDKLQNIMAHMTVSVGEYAGGIERPEAWADEIAKAEPGIKGVTIGLESPAMAIFDSARTVGTLRGIDIDRELKTGRLRELLFPHDLKEFGTHESGGKNLPGCIVGGAWRKAYGLKIGERATFLFSDEDGEARSRAFYIIGFFEGNNPYLETAAYVDRKFLADLIGVKGAAKTLYIWLSDPNRTDIADVRQKIHEKMAAIIKRDDPERHLDRAVQVETWQDKDNGFYKAMRTENLIMRIIMILFLCLNAFIIFLIFGRLVAEKVRDVGALRAMGAPPSGIRACFLMQASLIGGLGVVFGLIGAYFVITYLNPIATFLLHAWFVISGQRISMGDVFGPERILSKTLPFDIVLISLLAIFFALLGAFLPALRASRLNPVECLRHE